MKAKLKALSVKTDVVTVPEWDNETVVIREPAAIHWCEWQGAITKENEMVERIKADALMLSRVLLNNEGKRLIADEDLPQLIDVYSAVHSRLLNKAISLGGLNDSVEDTVKK